MTTDEANGRREDAVRFQVRHVSGRFISEDSREDSTGGYHLGSQAEHWYSEAMARWKANDTDGAIEKFKEIENEFPSTRFALRARNARERIERGDPAPSTIGVERTYANDLVADRLVYAIAWGILLLGALAGLLFVEKQPLYGISLGLTSLLSSTLLMLASKAVRYLAIIADNTRNS